MEVLEIGKTLAKRRKELKIPQSEMCQYLGVSRATLSGFENGKKCNLQLHRVGAMLDRLGLEIEIKEKSTLPTLDDLLEADYY